MALIALPASVEFGAPLQEAVHAPGLVRLEVEEDHVLELRSLCRPDSLPAGVRSAKSNSSNTRDSRSCDGSSGGVGSPQAATPAGRRHLRQRGCAMSSTAQRTEKAAKTATIRPLEDADLPAADHIMRLAFGTFLGVPEPLEVFGDIEYVRGRWLADPSAAYARRGRRRNRRL